MNKVRSRLLSAVLVAFASWAAVSCSGSSKEGPQKPDPSGREQSFDGTYYHDLPTAGWETETMDRMDLLLNTPWTPLAAIPKYSKGSYAKGTTYHGIPYSGVDSTYGTVGQHVSVYTFLSAVANPKSRMYTVDYRTPDGGTECCYYGTVCSTAVFFACGLPIVSMAGEYAKREYLTEKASNRIEDLELLDFLFYYNPGVGSHYMLVSDVARDKDGKLCKVTIWESQTPVVHVTTYTPAQLQARFERFGAPVQFFQVKPAFRHAAQPGYAEQKPVSGYTFPKDLMTDRGDKVTVALGESININILSSGYKSLELFKDERLFRTVPLNGTQDVELANLSTGLYKARLVTDGKSSDYTCFEVGDPNFSASHQGNTITMKISGHDGVPLYITMNDGQGGWARLVEKVSEGVYTYTGDWGTATNVRIHFAGEYGAYKGNSVKF